MLPPPFTTHHSPFTNFLPFAHQLADAAAEAIRPFFGAHGAVETKGDASPVTQADKAAEAAMRTLIEAHHPEHGIYGEEYGQTGLSARYIWVIDPIDGTRNFIAGGTQWGTLIALCDGGVPVLGILNQPITGERWVGVAGQPSTLNGAAIRTRPCPALAQAVASSTFCTPPDDARFDAVASQCADFIRGGDCYAFGLLARGDRDIVADTGLKPYDILALVPIIEGAGGRIRTWAGHSVTLQDYAQVLAVGDPTLAVPL
ncbi:MAG: histidinol phosphate phosphatase [Azospirillum brasilense]|nr:MAG: histidinol phosphate phosphatase [Azospirillum brasilense]